MCGIAGYFGEKENADKVLISILEKLEYRGYDSAGFAITQGEKIVFEKASGELGNLKEKLKEKKFEKGGLGIAHTRWATHGTPSTKNAHPHKVGKVFLVHNGIIENYKEIESFLKKQGYKFKSETDTEKIAGLFDYNLKQEKDSQKAFEKTLKTLRGAFAIVAFVEGENQLFLARLSSPLVVGVTEKDYFVASDALALSQFSKRVIYLDDFDYALLGDFGFRHFSFKDGKRKTSKIEDFDESLKSAEKGNFDSFMLKEIYEQAESIYSSIAGRVKNGQAILGGLKDVEKELQSAKEIHFVAAGTSFNASLAVKDLFESLGVPVFNTLASEAKYSKARVREGTVAFFISQSGETADTKEALKKYKKEGALCLGITNTVASSIARETHAGVYNHAGPEISVASTKAFTSQIAVLILIYAKIKGLKFTLDGKDKILLKELQSLPEILKKEIKKIDKKASQIAKALKSAKSMYTLARAGELALAFESALKIKEISYIHAEGYPSGELKHGPIALIEKDFPVFMFFGTELYEKTFSNAQEVKARDALLVSVLDKTHKDAKKISDYYFELNYLKSKANIILQTLPLQLLAYHLAKEKGLNVDKPRNLAKSVTVE